MTFETQPQLQFGDTAAIDASLSERARGIVGSEILKIAAEIRALVRAGRTVCNLTVGDFAASQFPIPVELRDAIIEALRKGETNYPPSDGLLPLREAVIEHVARTLGVRYPLESVLIASGARPLLYASYRCVLDPGDRVVYPVPSWNNNHYAWIAAAQAVEVPTRAEDGFMPRLAQLRPHLGTARLLVLNTPLNPAGTVMDPEELCALALALVEENDRRTRAGKPHLFMVHDQVYGALVFGGAKHAHPVNLVPEAAPWIIALDAISKTFASTGLRVGWVTAPPPIVKRMANLIGHVGAWAPRPEQVAVASFLRNTAAVDAFHRDMGQRVLQRLEALQRGVAALRAQGHPVDCIAPQGAIYLSLRLDLVGRRHRGQLLGDNEGIRRLLLEAAGIAVVPFQAFGLREETGWFRLSIGAVSLDDIDAAFPRLRTVLAEIE